jgi:hypothetical protein
VLVDRFNLMSHDEIILPQDGPGGQRAPVMIAGALPLGENHTVRANSTNYNRRVRELELNVVEIVAKDATRFNKASF